MKRNTEDEKTMFVFGFVVLAISLVTSMFQIFEKTPANEYSGGTFSAIFITLTLLVGFWLVWMGAYSWGEINGYCNHQDEVQGEFYVNDDFKKGKIIHVLPGRSVNVEQREEESKIEYFYSFRFIQIRSDGSQYEDSQTYPLKLDYPLETEGGNEFFRMEVNPETDIDSKHNLMFVPWHGIRIGDELAVYDREIPRKKDSRKKLPAEHDRVPATADQT